jgi:hypothetical protein
VSVFPNLLGVHDREVALDVVLTGQRVGQSRMLSGGSDGIPGSGGCVHPERNCLLREEKADRAARLGRREAPEVALFDRNGPRFDGPAVNCAEEREAAGPRETH